MYSHLPCFLCGAKIQRGVPDLRKVGNMQVRLCGDCLTHRPWRADVLSWRQKHSGSKQLSLQQYRSLQNVVEGKLPGDHIVGTTMSHHGGYTAVIASLQQHRLLDYHDGAWHLTEQGREAMKTGRYVPVRG